MTVTSSLNETFTDQLGNDVVGKGDGGVTPPNPSGPPLYIFTTGMWSAILRRRKQTLTSMLVGYLLHALPSTTEIE